MGATLHCGARTSHCGGFSCCRTRALGAWASVVVARGLWSVGSVVVAHGLSCSVACGIFPDQGSNPCPLHWQADSQPLRHQGSPINIFKRTHSGRMYSIFVHPNFLMLYLETEAKRKKDILLRILPVRDDVLMSTQSCLSPVRPSDSNRSS